MLLLKVLIRLIDKIITEIEKKVQFLRFSNVNAFTKCLLFDELNWVDEGFWLLINQSWVKCHLSNLFSIWYWSVIKQAWTVISRKVLTRPVQHTQYISGWEISKQELESSRKSFLQIYLNKSRNYLFWFSSC